LDLQRRQAALQEWAGKNPTASVDVQLRKMTELGLMRPQDVVQIRAQEEMSKRQLAAAAAAEARANARENRLPTAKERAALIKSEIDKKIAEAELLKKQYDEVAPLKEQLNALPPTLYRAMQLALEGKAEDAQEYLKSLPKVALDSKESKDLDDRVLIDTYLPGKIKPEQWEALTDPEADEEVVDAIEARIAILRDTAAELHDKKRTEIVTEVAKRQEAEKAAFENYQKSVVETIANAKNSPLRLFMDDNVVNDVQNGGFLGRFVQQDGVTPTAEAATLYLKALHFDGAMKAAETRGYERGKQEALLEATSRQPSMPKGAYRDPGDQPRGLTEQDMINQILMKANLTV
jgi:hypothetical protein